MPKQDNKQRPELSVEAQQQANTRKKIENETSAQPLKKEFNGPKGLEPTRYGDWESKGRCYDF